MRGAYILQKQDITDLEQTVLKNGRIQILPASTWKQFNQNEISIFCHKHACYGIPTQELVDWLKEEIGDRKAIEIGAGRGELAEALDIHATDNKMQLYEPIKTMYDLAGQPVIPYGDKVEEIDAIAAIRRYEPQIVIASWMTERFHSAYPNYGGNAYGPSTYGIVHNCHEYIMIGNRNIHDHPNFMRYVRETFRPDWLISRSLDTNLNTIYRLTRKK